MKNDAELLQDRINVSAEMLQYILENDKYLDEENIEKVIKFLQGGMK